MKNYFRRTLRIMGFFITFLGLLGLSGESAHSTQRIDNVNFTEQLEIFKELGFSLNEGVEISDVDRWGGPEEFEDSSVLFSLLYITLGQALEREPWTPLTNRCWNFDIEAIEDHGAYIYIIENMQRITRDELVFENVKDYVDIEEGKAWVSFIINGDEYKWDLVVDNDWADPQVFSKIVGLTKKYRTKGKYTYFYTGGQDIQIGYETPEDLIQLKSKTGLKIEWLN